MKTNTKIHGVVMLPTKKESNIGIYSNGKLYHSTMGSKTNDWRNHHIYFTSKGDFNVNDSVYDKYMNQVIKCTEELFAIKHTKQYFKVVATTDPELHYKKDNVDNHPSHSIDKDYDVAKIHDSFIEPFLSAYNNLRPITEVALEMVEACCKGGVHFAYCVEECENPIRVVKTRSDDNSVIVHQSKAITADEMHLNMQYYMEHCLREGYVTPQEWLTKHKHF